MGEIKKWEFDAPYEASFQEGMYSKWLQLKSNGFVVASFAVSDFGCEQACIEAAWNYAYGPSDAERIEALEARVKAADALAEWVEGIIEDGCPKCGGDCSSANPPVAYCPMQDARNDLAAYRATTQEQDQ